MNKIVGIVHAGLVDEAESIVNIFYIDGKMINGAKYHLRVFDVHKNILRYKSHIIACHIIICYYSG